MMRQIEGLVTFVLSQASALYNEPLTINNQMIKITCISLGFMQLSGFKNCLSFFYHTFL